jgi:hypothetical protein
LNTYQLRLAFYNCLTLLGLKKHSPPGMECYYHFCSQDITYVPGCVDCVYIPHHDQTLTSCTMMWLHAENLLSLFLDFDTLPSHNCYCTHIPHLHMDAICVILRDATDMIWVLKNRYFFLAMTKTDVNMKEELEMKCCCLFRWRKGTCGCDLEARKWIFG